MNELNSSLNGMAIMEESKDYVFHLVIDPNNPRLSTNDNKNIDVIFSGSTGSFVHESKHGEQLCLGDLNSTKNSKGKYDPGNKYGVNDEVEAYRAEYAFTNSLTFNFDPLDAKVYRNLLRTKSSEEIHQQYNFEITDFKDINPASVSQMREGGELLYPKAVNNPKEWINN